MQENRKIYPSGQKPARWIGWLLLVLSAVIVLTGLGSHQSSSGTITPLPTATPLPMDERFDETMETTEWTLPEVCWYALQLGAFDSEESAQALAAQYRQRGAAGYIWQDERHRVLAAIYATEADARSVRQQISQLHEVECYLYCIRLPSIRVSIHGMRGQIEILQAAFLHAGDLIDTLQQYTLQSDRSEIGRDELRASLHSLLSQTEVVRQRMQQRFPEPRNATVSGLIALFSDYAGFVSALDQEEADVFLGAQLKHQTIHSLDLLRQVYDTLGNT